MASVATGVTATFGISQEAAAAIRTESFLGLKALRRRGAEIGGILVGSRLGDFENFAEDFISIETEHLYGPSYRLSPLDLALLRAKATEISASGREQVIAFCRSCTGESFTISQDDIDAVRNALPTARFIVIAKPSNTGDCDVKIFGATGDGEWLQIQEQHIPMFAAIGSTDVATANVPSTNGPAKSRPAPSTETVPQTKPQPKLQLVERKPDMPGVAATRPALPARPQAPPKRTGSTGMIWAAVVLGGVLIAAAMGISSARNSSRTLSPALDVALSAQVQGNGLQVAWNKSIPSDQFSNGAVLQIQDGGQSREIRLDSNQVRHGSLLYVPESNDVNFRIEFRGNRDRIADSVRVLGGHRVPVSAPSNAVPVAVPSKSVDVKPLQKATSSERRVSSARFELPSLNRTPGGQQVNVQEVAPPEIQTGLVASNLAAVPGPALPKLPAINEQAAQPPVPARKFAPDARDMGALAQAKGSGVRIEVTVDTHGRVTEARNVTSGLVNARALDASLKAARKWRFEPATNRGVTVDGKYTIAFPLTSAQ